MQCLSLLVYSCTLAQSHQEREGKYSQIIQPSWEYTQKWETSDESTGLPFVLSFQTSNYWNERTSSIAG